MKAILFSLVFLCLVSCSQETSPSIEDAKTTQARSAYSEIYDNGQVRVQGWMENGKRIGHWITYYEDGVRWSEDNYLNDRKNGITKSYYRNGLLRYKGYYIEDEEAGTWNFYNEEGVLVEKKDFNE